MPPHEVLGVPCTSVVSIRGCRARSSESIVREMREEHRARGARLFFHDDGLLGPSAARNLARCRHMGELLRAAGMTRIGLSVRCRPDDVDRELFAELRSIGMVHADVCVETGTAYEHSVRATKLLAELGVHSSLNVRIFDPAATLDGVAGGLDLIEHFVDTAFHFCRVELEPGSPRDPRVELLFRIATTVFCGRSLNPEGLASANVGLRFKGEVLRRFYPAAWDDAFGRGLRAVSRAIGESTVLHMRRALGFVRGAELRDHAAANVFTLALARSVARSDVALVGRVKAARHEVEVRAGAAGARLVEGCFEQGIPSFVPKAALEARPS
jgi:hypothetical protein